LERALEGRDQLRKLVESQAGEIQELYWTGLQVSEPYTGHGWCLLSLYRDVRGASYHKESGINSNRFSLTIHPEKTVLIEFKRPPSRDKSAGGKGSFDFLGFTHYWAKTRRGYWVIKRKTVRKRLRRFMKEIWTWCRKNRHEPLQEQYRTLGAKLRGHYQYYGIRGNFKMLEAVFEHTERAWRYWLSRRSHKGHLNWQKFVDSLRHKLPLPKPRIIHSI